MADSLFSTEVMHRKDISSIGKVLLGDLMGRAVEQKSHAILVRPGKVAEDLHVNRGTIARALLHLEKAGLITREGPKDGPYQRWRIMSEADFAEVSAIKWVKSKAPARKKVGRP